LKLKFRDDQKPKSYLEPNSKAAKYARHPFNQSRVAMGGQVSASYTKQIGKNGE